MAKGILVASFGTTVPEARVKSIAAVENAVATAFPAYQTYHAWTSNMVCKALAKRGEVVPGICEALRSMAAAGINEAFVLPTHLLCGDEYDKLSAQAQGLQGLFDTLKIAQPLLIDTANMGAVLDVLGTLPLALDEALVLMGHGTGHSCNTTYATMAALAWAQGKQNFFIGTVEATPNLDAVLETVQAAGYHKVVLTPLLLVAGQHAADDMVGDSPTSWKNRFANVGIACRMVMRGLGEYPQIQALYCRQLGVIL